MRWGAGLALVIGLTITTVLIVRQGFSEVGAEVWRGSSALLPLLLMRFVQIVLASVSWRILLGEKAPARRGLLFVYRWIRDSINQLLPVGRVGGDLVGARLLVLGGTRLDVAAASVLADKTAEVFGLLGLSWTGLLLGWRLEFPGELMKWATVGLSVFSLAIVAFYITQRLGLVKMAEHLVLKLGEAFRGKSAYRPGQTQETLLAIYARPTRLLWASLLYFIEWSLGAVGIYFALKMMGHPIALTDAFVLEGLTQAIAAVAFVMPAGLGAQEAGYMMVGELLGLPSEVGLALSLIRRVAELIAGVPGIITWQALEGRHLFRKKRLAPAAATQEEGS
jgi:putative membrane protein